MKWNKSFMSFVVACIVVIAGCEVDRDVPETDPMVTEPEARAEAHDYKASNFMGMEVRNHEGEGLGSVDDMVVDLETGEIAYVVISTGEILGVGGEDRAVPPEALTIARTRDADRAPGETYPQPGTTPGATGQEPGTTPEATGQDPAADPGRTDERTPADQPGQVTPEDRTATDVRHDRGDMVLLLDVPAERWEEAPDFDRDAIETGDPGFRQQTQEFFGTQPREIREGVQWMWASDLRGQGVVDMQDEQIGSIDDIIVDLEDGRAPFAIVTVRDHPVDLDEDTYAVPLDLLSYDAEENHVRISAQADAFQQAQAFETEDWEQLRQTHTNQVFVFRDTDTRD